MTPLRLLPDQMIDNYVAADLRAAGHDICTVGELSMARADDAEILEVAIQQDRVLVDLRRIIRANHQRIDRDILNALGKQVWERGGEEVLRFIELTLTDQPFPT